MWKSWARSARAHPPGKDTKIVFAKIPVVKYAHAALDHVRRGEHRALKFGGDERPMGPSAVYVHDNR